MFSFPFVLFSVSLFHLPKFPLRPCSHVHPETPSHRHLHQVIFTADTSSLAVALGRLLYSALVSPCHLYAESLPDSGRSLDKIFTRNINIRHLGLESLALGRRGEWVSWSNLRIPPIFCSVSASHLHVISPSICEGAARQYLNNVTISRGQVSAGGEDTGARKDRET